MNIFCDTEIVDKIVYLGILMNDNIKCFTSQKQISLDDSIKLSTHAIGC